MAVDEYITHNQINGLIHLHYIVVGLSTGNLSSIWFTSKILLESNKNINKNIDKHAEWENILSFVTCEMCTITYCLHNTTQNKIKLNEWKPHFTLLSANIIITYMKIFVLFLPSFVQWVDACFSFHLFNFNVTQTNESI